MATKINKRVSEIRQLYNLANSWTRKQWENINQKGYEFAHDEQLTYEEKKSLEEQGMPHGKKYLMYLVKHNIM